MPRNPTRARELSPSCDDYWLAHVSPDIVDQVERERLATEAKSDYYRGLAFRSAKRRRATASERAALEEVAAIVLRALERAS